MLDSPPPAALLRDKLVSLLDYVEQVVRLDERVAFDLADYKLGDGRVARFTLADTGALPGVTHDTQDEDGAAWLSVERLARSEPPAPPADLADWIIVVPDPARPPETRERRVVTVDAATRLMRIDAGACASSFEADPPAEGAPVSAYRQTLLLSEQATTAARLARWIGESWAAWAALEGPRRRTIALYEGLYRLLQQVEVGGGEAPIEVVCGIGLVRWRHAGRRIERPLLERPVDLELDAARGTIRVRPTVADATVDLKPYEEMGVANLGLLDELIRREIDRAGLEDGVSPFRRASFEPILAAAAVRLQPDGLYRPGTGAEAPADGLTIDDHWVLFARPRSAHVLLADIDRLKTAARDPDRPIEGLAARLVTEPSAALRDRWTPLSDTIGGSAAPEPDAARADAAGDVFFPKPVNDDQIAIVHRLARSDGLVVQGPPGTGKTHTIANLICHAMATGQRVLVVSRGEAALAVLRDQLPDKVRPLAIALLSNERQGLGQVEGAIRAVQTIVEGSRPEIRLSAIRRCEAEIVKARQRLAGIDAALDALAADEGVPIGPQGEKPADLARRIAALRTGFAWFTDRPTVACADTGLTLAALRDLAEARRRVGELIDHRGLRLPAPDDLPTPEIVAGWHTAMLRGDELAQAAAAGPASGWHLAPADGPAAEALVAALDGLGTAAPAAPWLRPFVTGPRSVRPNVWSDLFDTLSADWIAADAARATTAAHAVDLPPRLIDDPEARAAVQRGARGERLWPLLSLGRGAAKAHVAAIRVRGAPVREDDATSWGHVLARLSAADGMRDLEARWRAFAHEAGAPQEVPLVDLGGATMLRETREAVRRSLATLPALRAKLPPVETLATAPDQAEALAGQLRQTIEAARLQGARAAAARVSLLFADGEDRTSMMVRRVLDEALGRADVPAARIEATWRGLRLHCEKLHAHAGDFQLIAATTASIAAAGAPAWAERLAREPAGAPVDALIPADWREAWDFAVADGCLARRAGTGRLTSLAAQRAEVDVQSRRLFVELVRERTFYALERRLSPSVKAALVEFVRALGRLGKGTGRGAGRQRRIARDAMRRCYDAIPCWIMPTWRVAEQLPSDLAAFDLVILDEASQSDVTELPAVLRGRKILVVGDDRQVSPMAPFVPQAKIDALRRRHLAALPFASLLEPGESLYTLMQAVFPDERLMLKEHFRCVEPIIRFSMGFYPEALLPLRIPSAAERLDPPLIDIYVPHGQRDGARKVNRAEADIIVEEIAALTTAPDAAARSIGVISLVGGEQAEHIRMRLSERLGAEIMQRHAILCGDSATFQGNERDIVFLSMVADRSRKTALTMLRYAQRFNVAMSRGRDRVVLVRSVRRDELNPADLKARLIQHFEQPMPLLATATGDPLDRCESGFEREVMGRLLARGYRVTPQVGALGFRIDMVVEGEGGRRLAVECDGDAFHGPERWREDMARQRVLERVGWRFWRCFASTFYADPDGTVLDLVETLTKAGIEPGEAAAAVGPSPWVDHRVASAPAETPPDVAQAELPLSPGALDSPDRLATAPTPMRGAALGDRLVLALADDGKTVSVRLDADQEDWSRGLVAVSSPLGQALLGCEEDEEVDMPFATGSRRVLVQRLERAAL